MSEQMTKRDLLNKALELIKEAGLEKFNQLSYWYDVASYVLRAATGQDDIGDVNTGYIYNSLLSMGFDSNDVQSLIYGFGELMYDDDYVYPDNWFEIIQNGVYEIMENLEE